MTTTTIEWTDRSWNPVTGCTPVSPGCDRCYAAAIAHRFAGTPAFPDGFALTLRPERLTAPLRWRRPARVFVNSMSDLFHRDVPDAHIAAVWAVMGATPRHTFQVLTKRHARMRALLGSPRFRLDVLTRARELDPARMAPMWPLPNVWVGVSVEDQARADLRVPCLIDTPAAIRFLSCEPLLGPIDLRAAVRPRTFADGLVDTAGSCLRSFPGIDWVIIGGESGPGARRMDLDWAAALVEQCRSAATAVFVKQLGSAHGPGKANQPDTWPPALRVRQYPPLTDPTTTETADAAGGRR